MIYTTHSPDETSRLAVSFARSLVKGSIVALTGELGAGKTRFVQGLAKGLNIPLESYVRSPTFALINVYVGGRLPLYHFDFYRLNNLSDTRDLGLDEYLFGEGVTVIEWAEKFIDELPANTIRITFEIVDERTRKIVTSDK